MTYYIETTDQLSKWLRKLKNRKAKAAILKRIELIEFTGKPG
jgi:putative component of toxin-antitoxin plasmid stabilization module